MSIVVLTSVAQSNRLDPNTWHIARLSKIAITDHAYHACKIDYTDAIIADLGLSLANIILDDNWYISIFFCSYFVSRINKMF